MNTAAPAAGEAGTLGVSIAADRVTDIAGNPNLAQAGTTQP